MLIARFGHSIQFRVAEWMSAGAMMLWGSIILRPSDLFSRPIYEPLARVADEPTWGAAFLLIGFWRVVVLLINGSWRASPGWRSFCSFAGVFLWFTITLGIIGSGEDTTAYAAYPIFLLADCYSLVRSGRDARAAAKARAGLAPAL